MVVRGVWVTRVARATKETGGWRDNSGLDRVGVVMGGWARGRWRLGIVVVPGDATIRREAGHG